MYFMQLMGLLHFSSQKTLFSRQTIVFKSKAAYSSSVLSNCSFITTLWIQISLSTCFTALTWARIFSPKSARTQISFSDVEGENERKSGCRDKSLKLLILFHGKRWRGETERTHESFVLACCGASKRRSMQQARCKAQTMQQWRAHKSRNQRKSVH